MSSSRLSACKLASMSDPEKSSESESESEKDLVIDVDEVTLTKVLPGATRCILQCVLALALVLDVVKSALWRNISSSFRPDNNFAGPGDVACCLAALDHNLKIARVSKCRPIFPTATLTKRSVRWRAATPCQPTA